jgi:hypothetical protein
MKAEVAHLEKERRKWRTSIEIKIFRTAGYILFYHKGNGYILCELKVGPIDEKLIR